MKELLEQGQSPVPPSLGLSFHNLEIRVIIPQNLKTLLVLFHSSFPETSQRLSFVLGRGGGRDIRPQLANGLLTQR